ncbi:MAG: hypothetical protein KAT17_00560, partial [Candidatus Aminicenantes bacterium]|nr:hypothetical protein [Candidatus Aminicenantes bacterium]
MSTTKPKRIQVISYDGYRQNEKPRQFILNTTLYSIQTILNRSLKEDMCTGERFYCYEVLTEDNR